MVHKGFKKYIRDKKFYKLVIAVALPLMLQQLATSSVNLLDNLMIGQLGDAALGAVAAVNRFYMIAIFATNGVLAASSIYIAQFFGAKDEEHMKQSFRFALIVAYLFAIVAFFLGTLFPEQIIRFFTADVSVIALGMDYIRIAAWTFMFMALSLAVSSSMRSIGESHIPLRISVTAVIINGILNYIFIFGHFGVPAMGVKGAAYATVIARFIEAALFLYIVIKRHFPFATRIKDLFKISKRLVKTIIAKATPLGINELLWSGGMATLFKLYATRGSEVLSGYSIANTIGDLFFVLFGGMAVASTILISQPLGANNLDEARDNAYGLLGFSFILAIVFGVLMFASSFIIPNLYNISDEARYIATTALRIMSVMFWVYMINTECYFILRAGGDMKSTMAMDSLYMWIINLPIVGFFAYYTSLPIIALYLIGQSTDLLKMAFSFHLVKKEKWVVNLTNVVHDEII